MDRHEANHKGRDKGACGEDGPESSPGLAGADGCDRREDIGCSIAEGEEGNGSHAGGEVEVGGELGGDKGEVVLGSLDEDVEVE